MNHEDFTCLCQHANRLAEGALQQLAAEILKEPAGLPALTPEESAAQEEQALSMLQNLDLSSMMDGMPWDNSSGETGSDVPGFNDSLLAPESGDPSLCEPAATPPADHFATLLLSADQGKLRTLLSALPAGLPNLTRPLDDAGFAQWLDIYRRGDPALDELVSHVCSLSRR